MACHGKLLSETCVRIAFAFGGADHIHDHLGQIAAEIGRDSEDETYA